MTDLREAFKLCRELKERSIITWTAAALAKSLIEGGDTSGARRTLTEAAEVTILRRPGPGGAARLRGRRGTLLAEGERDGALEKAQEPWRSSARTARTRTSPPACGGLCGLFGPDAAGGPDEVERARDLLERTHSEQAIREPSLARTQGTPAGRTEP